MELTRGGDGEAAARWAVYPCVDGSVHVRLQDTTLTFTPSEFAQLVQLLRDAQIAIAAAGIASERLR